MDALTALGLASAAVTLVAWKFEHRSHWGTLVVAVGCVCCSAYGFLAAAWVFGILGFAGYVAMMRRWMDRIETELSPPRLRLHR